MTINITVDTGAIGSFNYTINYWDGIGNGTPDSVMVNVNATPSVNSPADQLVGDLIGVSIPWIVTDTDDASGGYEILKDGISYLNGTWNSGTALDIPVDLSSIGSSVYTINYWDGISNGTPDSVTVVVNATPSINNPADQSIPEGSIATISWIIMDSDDANGSYEVFKNGVSYFSGTWNSGVAFGVDVDTSIIGQSIYTINYWDGISNGTSDSVIINVNATPSITSPADQLVAQGSAAVISWSITDPDDNSGGFEVFKDGTSYANGSWDSSVPITISVDTNVTGSFIFTVNYWDNFSNKTSNPIIVTVNATPTAVALQSQVTVTQGATNACISWNITDTDDGNGTYRISRNGTIIANGTWISGSIINYSIDTTETGIFIYQIEYDDGISSGIPVTITVTVTHRASAPAGNDFTYLWILIPAIIGGAVVGLLVLVKKNIIQFPKIKFFKKKR
ncbi:MAG: hypothetical protein ACTSRA_20075 [Promethearchaeota archaeon]